MKTKVVEVSTRKLEKAFFRLSSRIYREDPFWVPLTARGQQEALNPQGNPALEPPNVEYAKYLALRAGEPVGRILVSRHAEYARRSGENGAFLGLFECVEDERIAALLFRSAAIWAHERNLHTLYGPFLALPGYEGGVPANDQPRPYALTQIYGAPYYSGLFRSCGFVPLRSIHTYVTRHPGKGSRHLKGLGRIRKRRNASGRYVLRPIRTERFSEELERIRIIANDAFEDYPFFLPITPDQMRFNFSGLERVLAKELSLILEDRGTPVGFILTLYNIHPAFLALRSKPLLHRIGGSIRILRRLNSCKEFVLLLVGLKKAAQGKALPELASGYLEGLRSAGAEVLYTSFVHQENHLSSNAATRLLNMEIDRTYVIYNKAL